MKKHVLAFILLTFHLWSFAQDEKNTCFREADIQMIISKIQTQQAIDIKVGFLNSKNGRHDSKNHDTHSVNTLVERLTEVGISVEQALASTNDSISTNVKRLQKEGKIPSAWSIGTTHVVKTPKFMYCIELDENFVFSCKSYYWQNHSKSDKHWLKWEMEHKTPTTPETYQWRVERCITQNWDWIMGLVYEKKITLLSSNGTNAVAQITFENGYQATISILQVHSMPKCKEEMIDMSPDITITKPNKNKP